MTDRPISFKLPMLRAIIEGRKTQTRRVRFDCRPGDVLWVREAWTAGFERDRLSPSQMVPFTGETFYKDGHKIRHFRPDAYDAELAAMRERYIVPWHIFQGRHRASMHMPRWASRLTLEVVDVRQEPLNSISRDDAKAEGLEWVAPTYGVGGIASSWNADPRESFRALWQGINGPDSWTDVPVDVVTFRAFLGNIDRARVPV